MYRPSPELSPCPTYGSLRQARQEANTQDLEANDTPLCQSTTIRSIKSLVPLLDRVLVQRVKAEAKTASGIFLPESSVKELNEGKVLAVGPGALDKDGKRLPMGVTNGDRVLIPQVRDIYREMDGVGSAWVLGG
ncbi:Cpn10-domain-containing protein [Coniochaeta ligniaria NRRL 30616]|uniref:20 kDa chaperonin, chloroplastic n=1 Tax=Coniochaeta ligniaria NRRL 30616 TaxID=1408157 RepID=A0A1J7IXS3_9PEZI|nr:Cpn10-domain-containing protein [Coniochaeta ligniaria NRRL 30616]